nr:MAG TPA: biofilm operon protein [Caudoviricetes sp.]
MKEIFKKVTLKGFERYSVFGSKSEAAKKLGVNEKTIYNYLHGATKPIGYELLEVM